MIKFPFESFKTHFQHEEWVQSTFRYSWQCIWIHLRYGDNGVNSKQYGEMWSNRIRTKSVESKAKWSVFVCIWICSHHKQRAILWNPMHGIQLLSDSEYGNIGSSFLYLFVCVVREVKMLTKKKTKAPTHAFNLSYFVCSVHRTRNAIRIWMRQITWMDKYNGNIIAIFHCDCDTHTNCSIVFSQYLHTRNTCFLLWFYLLRVLWMVSTNHIVSHVQHTSFVVFFCFLSPSQSLTRAQHRTMRCLVHMFCCGVSRFGANVVVTVVKGGHHWILNAHDAIVPILTLTSHVPSLMLMHNFVRRLH